MTNGYHIEGPYDLKQATAGPLYHVKTPHNLKDLADVIAKDVLGFGDSDLVEGARYRARKYRNSEPVGDEIEFIIKSGKPRRV